MRRMLFSLGVGAIVAVAAVGRAQAQIPLNIVAGPTFSNLRGSDTEGAKNKTGFFVAAGTDFALGETVALSPYVAYVQKGATEEGTDDTFSLDYIEIPIFLGIAFPVGESAALSVAAGPQISFNINCDFAGFDCSDEPDFNSTDFGIVGSASLGFPISESTTLAIGGGADFSLTDYRDDVDAKSRAFYLFAGLNFALGGGM
jgi:Outer membrane protein beta-barrel domain